MTDAQRQQIWADAQRVEEFAYFLYNHEEYEFDPGVQLEGLARAVRDLQQAIDSVERQETPVDAPAAKCVSDPQGSERVEGQSYL